MFIYSGKISEPRTAINDKQNSFETWKRLLKTYKAVLITRQKLVELFSFKDSVYWFILCFSHYGVHFTQLIADKLIVQNGAFFDEDMQSRGLHLKG